MTPIRRLGLLVCGLVCLSVATHSASAFPKAGLVPKTWQLDFKFQDLERFVVTLPGDTSPTVYWYMVYEVTNNTGQDVQFFPSFRILTNRLTLVEGGAEINPKIYDLLKARHKRDFPFLASPKDVSGLLLQGEGNARASVAVFRQIDPKANQFTVYVSGLSGDLARVPNPAFNPDEAESEENPKSFLLRRTLGISYDLPGDANSRSSAIPVRKTRSWVMR